MVLVKHSLDCLWSLCHIGILKLIAGDFGRKHKRKLLFIYVQKIWFSSQIVKTLINKSILWKYRYVTICTYNINIFFVLSPLWKYTHTHLCIWEYMKKIGFSLFLDRRINDYFYFLCISSISLKTFTINIYFCNQKNNKNI